MSADGSISLPLRGKTIRAADLFCGAGGTSTGAQRAIRELGGKLQLVAVNHWDVAIATHSRMHPEATHLCADLEHVRPREAVPGGVLDILMASPTCTYYSRARGGRPVHDQQRMDPWHVVRWCTELRVHRLLVENVPEMMEWGPCDIRTGRPIPSRKGEYFRAWIAALEAIGFRVDYKVLVCADYGDPTTRERFFLIGRSDGKRLSWPEPTHAKGGKTDLLGTRKPWRAAAEVIDWTRKGTSIFTRKKPLKPNTVRRILAGAIRYHWPQPHIEALQALLDGREPVLDLVQVDGEWRTAGSMSAMVMATGAGGAARAVDQPVPGLTTTATPHFIQPLLMGVGSGNAARSVQEPAPTITTGGGSAPMRKGNARPQLIEPLIIHRSGREGRKDTARPCTDPMFTATTAGAGYLAEPLVSSYYGSTVTSHGVSLPLAAVTTKARFGLAEPVMIRAGHGDAGHTADGRVLDADAPLPTVTGSNEVGVAQALIVPLSNSSSAGVPRSADSPLTTITTAKGGDKALAQPIVFHLTHHGERAVNGAEHPLPAITGANRGELGLSQPFLVPNFGEAPGQQPRTHAIDEPVPTITAQGHIQVAEPVLSGCRIDIHYRMLHWRELAGAMSFDDEGEVYDFAGTGTDITKQIGNAVPGRTAKALIKELLKP